MKGSKRDRWLKDGIKESRKVNKHLWNRKARRCKLDIGSNCEYKKLAGETMYDKVT